jgi:hypothetical protein
MALPVPVPMGRPTCLLFWICCVAGSVKDDGCSCKACRAARPSRLPATGLLNHSDRNTVQCQENNANRIRKVKFMYVETLFLWPDRAAVTHSQRPTPLILALATRSRRAGCRYAQADAAPSAGSVTHTYCGRHFVLPPCTSSNFCWQARHITSVWGCPLG